MGRGKKLARRVSQVVVLDSEAVQALSATTHPKHRKVVAYTQVVAGRKRRGAEVRLVVPTVIRVEAGWSRPSSSWAFANHLRITDAALYATAADLAAVSRTDTGVSVADAHLGAVIQSLPAEGVTVLTSDPEDMRRVAGDAFVTIVTI